MFAGTGPAGAAGRGLAPWDAFGDFEDQGRDAGRGEQLGGWRPWRPRIQPAHAVPSRTGSGIPIGMAARRYVGRAGIQSFPRGTGLE